MIFQFHLAQFIDIFIIHSARLYDVSILIRLSRLLDTPPITRLVSMKALLHFECTLERVHIMLLIYLKWTRNRIIRYNHFSFQFEHWSLLLALRSVTLDWIRYILLKFIQCIPLIWWDGFIHEIWKKWHFYPLSVEKHITREPQPVPIKSSQIQRSERILYNWIDR